jgi:hypothetical protein
MTIPVRVAVIDSGVHIGHPHIHKIAGGAAFGPSGDDYSDRLGHGTAVMAAIQEKAPDAEYYGLRVFHSALRTRIEYLLEALEWCLSNRIDIVNLSLGTNNPEHAPRFEEFLERAETLVVVAAAGSLPGSLAGTIAVELDPNCPRDEYRHKDGIYAASGHPRPIPGVPQEFNLQGVSFAVANLTGIAARVFETCAPRTPLALRRLLVDSATLPRP